MAGAQTIRDLGGCEPASPSTAARTASRPDGVHLRLNRGWPFVGLSEPVVRAFVEKHGEDPRTLDPMDRRWWQHQARHLSEFVGAVPGVLDAEAARQGRRLGLSVTVMVGVEQCLSLALDVAHWIAQGWVDEVIVHPCWLPQRWLDTDLPAQLSVTPARIAEVKRPAEGTGARVYADLSPRYLPATEYPRRAREYYDAGADGPCFWDTFCRVPRKSEWSAIRRLGRVEELAEWARIAAGWRRVVPLLGAAGMSLDPAHTPATNG